MNVIVESKSSILLHLLNLSSGIVVAMGVLCVLREEFRLKRLGFGGVDSECFFTFFWWPSRLIFLIYRFLMAAFTLTMLTITATAIKKEHKPPHPWNVYLTNWSYTSLTIYMLMHFLVTLVTFIHRARHGGGLITRTDTEIHQKAILPQTQQGNASPYQSVDNSSAQGVIIVTNGFSIVQAVVWLFYTYVSAAAIIVTLVFWIALFPQMHGPAFSMDNVQLHLLNSVIILIENSVSAIPVRLLHVTYATVYGLIYTLFSVIYWTGNHKRVIYPILDWNNPGTSVGYVILLGLVLSPLVQFALFGIYRLKIFIYKKVHHVPDDSFHYQPQA